VQKGYGRKLRNVIQVECRLADDLALLGGGVMIEAGGSLLGAIGVSGGPAGEEDENCAKAGLDAIRDRIEF